MTGAWVPRVKSQVSCESTLEGATEAASIVSCSGPAAPAVLAESKTGCAALLAFDGLDLAGVVVEQDLRARFSKATHDSFGPCRCRGHLRRAGAAGVRGRREGARSDAT